LISKVFATLTSPKVLLRKRAQVKKVTHLKPKELQQATSNYLHRTTPMTFASGLVLHYKERIAERQSQLASAEAGDARLLELRGALQEAGQIGQQKISPVRTHISYIYN
jgi:prolyl-tRNA editing enzyme YbaK/EbsC (Cys-tRNA(Pro) deacylase)